MRPTPWAGGIRPLAEPLRSNVPGSVRTSILSLTGDLFIIPWSKLLYSAQTGQSAFDKYFGVPFFDHLTSNPEEASMFSDLLIGLNSSDPPAVAAAYDFSSFSHIADIGGATGHLLATVLASPRQRSRPARHPLRSAAQSGGRR